MKTKILLLDFQGGRINFSRGAVEYPVKANLHKINPKKMKEYGDKFTNPTQKQKRFFFN